MLTTLKHFSASTVDDVLKELRGIDQELLKLLERKIAPFFQLLGNAVVDSTYVDRVLSELTSILKYISMCKDSITPNLLRPSSEGYEMKDVLFTTLSENIHEVNNAVREIGV